MRTGGAVTRWPRAVGSLPVVADAAQTEMRNDNGRAEWLN